MVMKMKLRNSIIINILISLALMVATYFLIVQPILQEQELEEHVEDLKQKILTVDLFLEETIRNISSDFRYIKSNEMLSVRRTDYTSYLKASKVGFSFAESK